MKPGAEPACPGAIVISPNMRQDNPFWMNLTVSQRAWVIRRRYPLLFAQMVKEPAVEQSFKSELLGVLRARAESLRDE